MNIIDKLRAEIERRITDNTFGGKMELIDLLSFLDTLQEHRVDFPTTDEEMKAFLATHPKVEVPERYKKPDWVFEKANLDEAAKKYASEQEFYWIRENPYTSQEYAFKAGAMWDREQGVSKECVIGIATERIICTITEETLSKLDVNPGDKVIVQIRKKDE